MDRRRFLGLSAAATLAAVAGPRVGLAAPAAIREAWTVVTLEPRAQYSVGHVADIALIAGGHTSNPDGTTPSAELAVVDWVDLYDARADVWGSAKLSVPRMEPTIASAGPIGIVVGGNRGASASDALDIFDSANRSWSTARLAEPRLRPVTATAGSKILIVDGTDGVSSRTVEVFDTTSGTLITLRPPTVDEPRGWNLSSGGSTAFLAEISDAPVDAVHRYDADSGELTPVVLSQPREHPLVRVVGNRAFVVSSLGTGVDTMDAIDLASGQVTAMPLPRPDTRLFDVTGDQGNRLLLRAPAPGEPRDIDESQFDLFDAGTDGWLSFLLPRPRLGVRVVAHLGWYFFAGGPTRRGGPPSRLLDIYRTRTGEWIKGSLFTDCENFGIAIVGKRVVFAGGMEQLPGLPRQLTKGGDIVEVDGGAWGGGLSVARQSPLVTTAGTKALFVGGDAGCTECIHEPQAPIVDIFDATAW